MTMQEKIVIDLCDIAAIEYECPHCHARFCVSVDRFDRVIYQCPNCKEGIISGNGADASLEHFVQALLDLRNRKMQIKLELSSSDRASHDKD